MVAGYIVGGPLGGLVWHHLQYVIGLARMGYEVLFVEDSNDYASCYNPSTNEVLKDPSYGLNFIHQVFGQFNLQDRWAYFNVHTNEWLGQSRDAVERFAEETDVFLNLSGSNPLREIFQHVPARVFVDTDPAFTQIIHLTNPEKNDLAKQHTHFFTYGENFGKSGCTIPNDGFSWLPTRQPVVTDLWSYTTGNKQARWTTIMQWDSYKVRTFEGRQFGMKSASFDDYLFLPQQVNDTMELAMGGDRAPKGKLANAGWHLSNPLCIAQTPNNYQQYIQQSKGEWSIAKQGYVTSLSGWFSERSAAYLASGRPVVVQDTGFSSFMETGKGLLSFTTPWQAIESIKRVNSDYNEHCRQARQVAEEHLAAPKVLTSLLNQIV